MRFVKRTLPNGRVEFTATFYVVFVLMAAGLATACVGLVVSTLSMLR